MQCDFDFTTLKALRGWLRYISIASLQRSPEQEWMILHTVAEGHGLGHAIVAYEDTDAPYARRCCGWRDYGILDAARNATASYTLFKLPAD
jgi:hypothetical protein